jgi:tetratricopeptide (TPR) repeat protein
MLFDPNNPINKLCIEGMELEGKRNDEAASNLFIQAWNEASTNPEKFAAAHYMARHQKTIDDKLKWDETALSIASKIDDPQIKASFPSLYLNIGKGYEDLNDFDRASKNYQLARSFTGHLLNDGYGNMIKSGIENGLNRINMRQNSQ